MFWMIGTEYGATDAQSGVKSYFCKTMLTWALTGAVATGRGELAYRVMYDSSVELTQLVPTQITPDAGHRHPLCTPDAPKTHQWSDPESKSVIGVFPISTARRITTKYTSPPDSTPMRQVIVAEW